MDNTTDDIMAHMTRMMISIGVIVILLSSVVLFLKKTPTSPAPTSGNIQPTEKIQEEKANVEILATDLKIPWSLAFLPDGSALFTERAGQIRGINKSGGISNLNLEVKNVKHVGEGGLMGIAIDPEYPLNNFIYIQFTYSTTDDNTLNKVVRYTFDGNSLQDERILVDKIPGGTFHNGGRIHFGPDGFLYITTGDAQDPSLAQDNNSLAGKILRVTRDGNAAPGNPFGTSVYSYGHRNPQGLAWDTEEDLWETEHGPSGIWPNCCQDEVNKIVAGSNYGWPKSVGNTVQAGTAAPVIHSERDSWAPSGAVFYKNKLFFTALKGAVLFEFNPIDKSLTKHFEGEFGRIRDVVIGPDNFLYLLTNNTDGRGKPQTGDDKIIKVNPEAL